MDFSIDYDIVSLDRPPEDYFGYNYPYGRQLVLDAIEYLLREYGHSSEKQAIDILARLIALP